MDGIYDDFDKTYIWESLDPFDQTSTYLDKTNIIGVDPLVYPQDFSKNVCRIYLKNNYVYSNCKFYTGDIVEICPCDIISDFAVMNNDFGDKVFEIERNHKYALPHGYCQYYDVTKDPSEANCDYIWDPIEKQVVIKATKPCPKDTRLVLNIRFNKTQDYERQFNR